MTDDTKFFAFSTFLGCVVFDAPQVSEEPLEFSYVMLVIEDGGLSLTSFFFLGWCQIPFGQLFFSNLILLFN